MTEKDNRNSYGGLLRVFDRPMSRDWIFWLFAVSIVSSLAPRIGSGGSGRAIEPVSGLIDATFAVAVNYVIWAVIPSRIRSRVRVRRRKLEPADDQEFSSPNMHQNAPKLAEPSTLEVSLPHIENKRRFGRTAWALPAVIAALIGGLFLHGNWEYTRLLATIEGGEAVLESYNRDVEVLAKLLDTSAPNFNRARATEGVAKWERAAADRNVELQPWLAKLQGGGITFWNGGTASIRDLSVAHFVAWSQYLESESLDLFHSQRASRSEMISATFKELCAELETFSSFFAWPSSSRPNTMARALDICDD